MPTNGQPIDVAFVNSVVAQLQGLITALHGHLNGCEPGDSGQSETSASGHNASSTEGSPETIHQSNIGYERTIVGKWPPFRVPGLPDIIKPIVVPYIGPLPFDQLPPLPFEIPSAGEIEQGLRDIVGYLLSLGISPIAAGILAAYLQYLERQASGRLQSIPRKYRELISQYYACNIDDVRIAESVNTLHGQAITVENHIYFPGGIDFGTETGMKWLLHELEHVDQYRFYGGKAGFFGKYALESAAAIVENKSFNVHDCIGLEEDANRKMEEVYSAYRTRSQGYAGFRMRIFDLLSGAAGFPVSDGSPDGAWLQYIADRCVENPPNLAGYNEFHRRLNIAYRYRYDPEGFKAFFDNGVDLQLNTVPPPAVGVRGALINEFVWACVGNFPNAIGYRAWWDSVNAHLMSDVNDRLRDGNPCTYSLRYLMANMIGNSPTIVE